MERIVVGVDGSEVSRAALRWAADEASRRQATLEVVHAWHAPFLLGYVETGELAPGDFESDAEALLDHALGSTDLSGVGKVEKVLVPGGAAEVLLDVSKGATLLVVGSRGRGGFSGLLLGSVSQQVVHHATCPVLVIPPTAT